jgi:hypothetical protein
MKILQPPDGPPQGYANGVRTRHAGLSAARSAECAATVRDEDFIAQSPELRNVAVLAEAGAGPEHMVSRPGM